MKDGGRRLKARDIHLAVVAAGIVAGLLAVVGAATNPNPDARTNLLIYTPIEVIVGWTFLFIGLVAGRRRPENPTGLLMSIFGLTWFTYVLGWIHAPVPFYVAYWFRDCFLPVLAQLFVAYPSGRPQGRLERRVIVGVYGWYALLVLIQMPTYDPIGLGCRQCLPNPFYIRGLSWFNPAASTISQYGTLVVAFVVFGVVIWHWRQASVPLRRAMTPAVWAAVPVLGILVADQLDNMGLIPAGVQPVLAPLRWVTFAILPVALLVGVLRTRLSRAAITDLVIELSRFPMHDKLRDLLARALGDPSLELALALPDGSYVNSRGHAVDLPAPGSGRAVTAIESNGKPVAALIHDPAVDEEDPGLVAAAGSAARLALENERLQAEVRASLEEVRASRSRIVQAADSERRRLERDIHDGAQQRLVSLGLALGLARDHASAQADGALAAELEGAANQLKQALGELRELAQGIHPAVLTRAGIGPALRVLAELSSIPVEINDAPTERYPESVETAVYFVVSEAMTNAAKHSGATKIEVSVRRGERALHLDVRDDGAGGAQPAGGSGLVGMADRAAALGGRVEVSSPSGHGTLIHAEIPCE